VNILDILIVGGLALAIRKGYKKGVITSLFSLLGYLTGLLAAVLFSEVLAKVVDRSFNVTGKMIPWFSESSTIPAGVAEASIRELPLEQAEEAFLAMPLPESLQAPFLELIQDIAELPTTHGIETLGEGIAYLLSAFIITALCFIFLYVVVSRFLGKTIPSLFKKASPGPVNTLDHLGGALLGLLGGIISVGIMVAMLIPVAAIGAVKGTQSAGLLLIITRLFNDSFLVSKLSGIVISLIS